ncbi:hypothetical protein [Neolewinella antarctica]|uniref:Uncharacterized protein n=1 Tax=Neolewinella antarctica TaxID=442734 RepID=A0ABX0XFH9_9BACT|nr:hypothetical protein [Neolewinella antarctica]NJC27629.1 hypothetical protein [Neolewinella antarctica]
MSVIYLNKGIYGYSYTPYGGVDSNDIIKGSLQDTDKNELIDRIKNQFSNYTLKWKDVYTKLAIFDSLDKINHYQFGKGSVPIIKLEAKTEPLYPKVMIIECPNGQKPRIGGQAIFVECLGGGGSVADLSPDPPTCNDYSRYAQTQYQRSFPAKKNEDEILKDVVSSIEEQIEKGEESFALITENIKTRVTNGGKELITRAKIKAAFSNNGLPELDEKTISVMLGIKVDHEK